MVSEPEPAEVPSAKDLESGPADADDIQMDEIQNGSVGGDGPVADPVARRPAQPPPAADDELDDDDEIYEAPVSNEILF
jgi:hypothetical protein